MTTTELIEQLQEIEREQGEVPIKVFAIDYNKNYNIVGIYYDEGLKDVYIEIK